MSQKHPLRTFRLGENAVVDGTRIAGGWHGVAGPDGLLSTTDPAVCEVLEWMGFEEVDSNAGTRPPAPSEEN